MNRGVYFIVIIAFVFSALFAGCAQEKADSSSSAIEATQSMQSVQEKVDYLIKQAQAFYNSKDFQQTIDIAQYILQNLDSDSLEAKNLLTKAKEALTSAAKSALDDAKKSLGSFGQ